MGQVRPCEAPSGPCATRQGQCHRSLVDLLILYRRILHGLPTWYSLVGFGFVAQLCGAPVFCISSPNLLMTPGTRKMRAVLPVYLG